MRAAALRLAKLVQGAAAALAFAAVAFSAMPPAFAVQPDEILPDPQMEARARALSAELRCLVCQNQSIDDSNAPLARDLRLLVRERLKANDTDDQVRSFIVERYGEFVLLKPPLNVSTVILWLTPLFVLLGAIWLARSSAIGARAARSTAQDAPLNEAEKARLKDVLDRSRDS